MVSSLTTWMTKDVRGSWLVTNGVLQVAPTVVCHQNEGRRYLMLVGEIWQIRTGAHGYRVL